MPKSKIYCLIHINTGASPTTRYMREMSPTLANELNRSLESHNSPLRWITAKEFATLRLIRVFPRKTKASPDDELAYFGPPDLFAEADEVHVDVTFTYDKPYAEQLAENWKWVTPRVKVGGVAYGDPGQEFIPGRYIKNGYTFTSRGCPRRCWFCSVWKRDPIPRLLPIQDGWNILDDNLLSCPESHVRAVFAMLKRQNRQCEFTGGLEASILNLGFTPMAMLWKPETPAAEKHRPKPEWKAFQRSWARPAAIHARVRTATATLTKPA